ncbi:protein YgfX [Shewanella mesophila]|uniref:protein YgfX n=1 Tax=Shewanella mesophila TaxID=2864208 RepID=UPI00331327E9
MKSALILSWLRWLFKSVVAQRHNFYLCASFEQRLSLVIFAAVCLSSFLAWPPLSPLWFVLIKWFVITLVCCFFIYQWFSLKHWHLNFWLDESGKGAFVDREKNYLLKRLWISPFVVLFQMRAEQEKHLIIVWRDMLDDTSYRHLCRLLLRFG